MAKKIPAFSYTGAYQTQSDGNYWYILLLTSGTLTLQYAKSGVDVGAIEFIHTRIIEKRNAGCAILLCSADLDEVFRLSDRIITMYEGRITGEFRTSDITKEEIGWYMTGHREGKEAAKT